MENEKEPLSLRGRAGGQPRHRAATEPPQGPAAALPAPSPCPPAATLAVAVPRVARSPLPLSPAAARLRMMEAAMAEPPRPQLPPRSPGAPQRACAARGPGRRREEAGGGSRPRHGDRAGRAGGGAPWPGGGGRGTGKWRCCRLAGRAEGGWGF